MSQQRDPCCLYCTDELPKRGPTAEPRAENSTAMQHCIAQRRSRYQYSTSWLSLCRRNSGTIGAFWFYGSPGAQVSLVSHPTTQLANIISHAQNDPPPPPPPFPCASAFVLQLGLGPRSATTAFAKRAIRQHRLASLCACGSSVNAQPDLQSRTKQLRYCAACSAPIDALQSNAPRADLEAAKPPRSS